MSRKTHNTHPASTENETKVRTTGEGLASRSSQSVSPGGTPEHLPAETDPWEPEPEPDEGAGPEDRTPRRGPEPPAEEELVALDLSLEELTVCCCAAAGVPIRGDVAYRYSVFPMTGNEVVFFRREVQANGTSTDEPQGYVVELPASLTVQAKRHGAG
jgi:hypothetical protein